MTIPDPIRVLVVDDHAVVRRGLGAVLLAYDDLIMVGEAATGEEAIRLCQQLEPDVVLMDLVMPGIGGCVATREIVKVHPRVRVIALTSFRERDLVEEVLKAGAISYLLKNVSADELAGVIRQAVAGQSRLSPEAAEALIHGLREPDAPVYDLTGREREIIALMIQGLSNAEIAKKLYISKSTVKFHVSNILSRLGVSSRTEAVALAVKHNLSG